jgi:hypothetical protein
VYLTYDLKRVKTILKSLSFILLELFCVCVCPWKFQALCLVAVVHSTTWAKIVQLNLLSKHPLRTGFPVLQSCVQYKFTAASLEIDQMKKMMKMMKQVKMAKLSKLGSALAGERGPPSGRAEMYTFRRQWIFIELNINITTTRSTSTKYIQIYMSIKILLRLSLTFSGQFVEKVVPPNFPN